MGEWMFPQIITFYLIACKFTKKICLSPNISLVFCNKKHDFNIVHEHTININAQKRENMQVFEH